mmetsp:Transcript_28343/g.53269  ORF Transcript_28343/g.53269 Transcript_28343/m.53269 type:complete len:173 (-) Transcript_28343:112-630(-)
MAEKCTATTSSIVEASSHSNEDCTMHEESTQQQQQSQQQAQQQQAQKQAQQQPRCKTTCENDEGEDDEVTCPLFMEGLPRNFSKNTQLAAIASLLEDSVSEDTSSPDEAEHDRNDKGIQSNPWQAKIKKRGNDRTNRRQRKHTPYPIPIRKSAVKSKGSVGETTLFLNMWKL